MPMAVADQPRILLITRNLPPLVGGMEKLNYHILLELAKEFRLAVAGPRGCKGFIENAAEITVATFPSTPKSAFVLGSIRAAWQLGKSFRPDLVLCGSGATAPAGFLVANRLGIPLITYLHGLDIVTNNLIYKTAFLPAIRASAAIIVNSNNTAKLAVEHGINKNRIHVLHPGVDMPVSTKLEATESGLLPIAQQRPTLLSVGRLTERKGLSQFIANCMPELVKKNPDILFLIAGGEATEAIAGKQGIRRELHQLIQSMGLTSHVKLLGKVDDAQLSQVYLTSQLLVFPVLSIPGDVEGFGMVAVEAAAHGLPTIGFATGGVPDAISEGISGYLIRPGDYRQLTLTILKHLRGESTILKESCKQFASAFEWSSFGAKLRDIVGSLKKASLLKK